MQAVSLSTLSMTHLIWTNLPHSVYPLPHFASTPFHRKIFIESFTDFVDDLIITLYNTIYKQKELCIFAKIDGGGIFFMICTIDGILEAAKQGTTGVIAVAAAHDEPVICVRRISIMPNSTNRPIAIKNPRYPQLPKDPKNCHSSCPDT